MTRTRRILGVLFVAAIVAAILGCSGSRTDKDELATFAAADVVESIAERDQPAVSRAFGRDVSADEMSELSALVPAELADPDTPDARITEGGSWMDATAATASVRSVNENSTLTLDVTMAWDQTLARWIVTDVEPGR